MTRNAELVPILSRLKTVLGVNSDSDLAQALGVSPQTLGSWRARRSIPYALCIEFAVSRGLSLDWLLLGDGIPGHEATSPPGVATPHLLTQLLALPPDDQQAVGQVIDEKRRLRALESQLGHLLEALARDSSNGLSS